MIKTILALFRIRKLMRIEDAANQVIADVEAYNRRLNGTPPTYNDSKPPDGDDYNELLDIIDQLKRS
jgi:hypothetical protein